MNSVRKDEFNVRDGEHDSAPCVGVKHRPFGERLREERLRLGLTQAEMAEAGGVKRTTQHIYESDIRTPDLSYLLRVRDAGADLHYLVFGQRRGAAGPDAVSITPTTLSNIYQAMEGLAFDAEGGLLPYEKRLLMFQMLCASMTVLGGDTKALESLCKELSGYSIK